MKPLPLCAGLLFSLTTATYANLLVDGGFENPITQDGPPFVGLWEGFNGGGAAAFNTATMPRTGAQSLGLSINNTINTFAGAFQDVVGLTPGMSFSLDGWHATTSSPLNLGVEIRIEWRNSVSNTEVGRTPNATPVPTASYTAFNLSGLVPAGADTARVVYAIQSFSTNPLGNGNVFVDDMSFTVVPEPSSMALLGLGGLALVASRRKRA
ncbi:MAG TPA: PEP-CTERM sorting domain-containing protein [Verrucomicrobiae bacterium]|nr:PEP-CTERM sorting domain-containing protein [Verrucomicrobiae bacterium]